MKKVLSMILGLVFVYGVSFADTGDRSIEHVLNRVFNSGDGSLSVNISGDASGLNNISCDNLAISADEAGKDILTVISQDTHIQFIIDKNNNVGIGLSVPARPLTISNDNAFIQCVNATTGATANDGVTLGHNGTGAFLWDYENDSLAFATNNVQTMTINNLNNVGIGTTTPLTKLEIIGEISGDCIRFDTQNASPDTATLKGAILVVSKDTNGSINLNFYNGTVWRSL